MWLRKVLFLLGISFCISVTAGLNSAYASDYRDVITSYFGWRLHPVTGEWRFHDGVDFGYDAGTPIYALRKGTVAYASEYGGYGNCVIINLAGGLHTLYAHCSSLAVCSGEEVAEGATIAYVGSTGVSTGPHLHLTVWTDQDGYLDPLEWLSHWSDDSNG